MELLVGEGLAFVRGVIGLPQDSRSAAVFLQMTVQHVFGDVQDAVIEPFYLGSCKIPFAHLREWLLPKECLCDVSPEFFGVFDALCISGFISID